MASATETKTQNNPGRLPLIIMGVGAVGIVAAATSFMLLGGVWAIAVSIAVLALCVGVGLIAAQRLSTQVEVLHEYVRRIELGQLELATEASLELLESTPDLEATATLVAHLATRLHNAAQHLEYPEAHPLHPASRNDQLFTAIQESVSESARLNRQYTALQEVSSTLSLLPRWAATPFANQDELEDDLCLELLNVLGANYVCFYRTELDDKGHPTKLTRTAARSSVSLIVHARTFPVKDCLAGDALIVKRMKHHAKPPKMFEVRTCCPNGFVPAELLLLPVISPAGEWGVLEVGIQEPIPAKALEGLETASKAIGNHYELVVNSFAPKKPAFDPEAWAAHWLQTASTALVAVLPKGGSALVTDALAQLVGGELAELTEALQQHKPDFQTRAGIKLTPLLRQAAPEPEAGLEVVWLHNATPEQELADLRSHFATLQAKLEANTITWAQQVQQLQANRDAQESQLQALQSQAAVLANDAAGAHAELNNRAAQLAQAQQALAEETQRLAQTTQLVQELRHRWAALSHTLALAETDAQGLVVEANQSFWQLVGLGGQKPLNLKDHLQATGLAPGLGEALTHGKPWQGEWQVQTHTGQTRTLAGVAIPLGPDPAEAHPVLLALWDTTALHATLAEAKQALSTVHAQLSQRESELAIAQAELAQSRQWADQLASTLGVVQLDAAGNALMANSQASAMLAISASEWVGQPIESLLRIADANSPAQWLSHLASESPWSCRLRPAAQPHHPGALCSVMAHTPALGASVYTCLFVAPPQSEHASAEANQTESAWLRNISQTVYVAHASTEGVLQSINPAFASALGYAADELVGKPLEGLLKAEEAVGAARELRNALAATMLWRMELPLATQQGHTLWVQLAFSTLPGQEGQGRLLVGHNISQAKLMEAKVEELSVAYERTQSEATERTEQLQNMFANVPGIIYQRDAKPGYPIRLLNDQILNLLGYPVEDFAPGGSRSFTDLIHPDDLPRVVNELEHSLNRYEPYRIIYRVRNRVQAIRWVQDEGRGVFDSNGHLLHCDGVIFDISQQKTLESNLRQSSTLLKQQQMELAGQIKALNNAAIVSETDFKGIITYVNDEATHLWGYTRSELIGQKHSLLRSSYHSDTFYERMWEEISQGNVWQGEIVNRTKTDEELWCILTISPVLDINRKPFKYIAVAVDITRQKRQASRILDVLNEVKHHEQELMEQAQHLEEAQRELLDTHLELEARIQAINHSAIVSETDTNGFIRFVNEEACHIWGYERHELVGKPHSIINSGYHPEAFWTEMWDTLTRGNAWTGQVLNRAKDGREFWVQLSVTPVLDVQGKPTKFIGIAFDITPQRVQAERIRKALKESEQREENYRAELEALRSQASDALPHVGEMARALMLETPSPVLLAGANAELLAHNQAFESLTPEVGLHPHKVMQMPAARLGQKPRPLAEWLLMWPANAAEPSDLFLETPEGQAWAVLTVVPTREAYFGFRFALHAKPLADKLPDTPVWEAELAAHKTEVDRLRRELEQMENTLAEELRQLAQDYETTLSAQTAELAELRQRIAALN